MTAQDLRLLPHPRVPQAGSPIGPSAGDEPSGRSERRGRHLRRLLHPADDRAGRERDDASARLACDDDRRRAVRADDEPLDRTGHAEPLRLADRCARLRRRARRASGRGRRGHCGRPGRTPLRCRRPGVTTLRRRRVGRSGGPRCRRRRPARAIPCGRAPGRRGDDRRRRSHARGRPRAHRAGRLPPEASDRRAPPRLRAPARAPDRHPAATERWRPTGRPSRHALDRARRCAGEREDGERGGGGQRNERAEGEEAKPTMPSACFGAGALHAAPCLVAGLPAQDGSRPGRRGRSPTDPTRPCGGSDVARASRRPTRPPSCDAPAKVARSDISCAIFVPDGVTR